MTSVAAIEIGGTAYTLPALPESETGGGFAFGLYKAGSTLLNKAIQKASNGSDVLYVGLVQEFRKQGMIIERSEFSEKNIAALYNYLDRNGTIFGGWREFPSNYRLPLRSSTRTFLLVRDPRDMLTSHYFSLKFSHTTVGPDAAGILRAREKLQKTDIDTFVLSQAENVLRYFQGYKPLQNTTLMLRRYEDIIFEKQRFVADLSNHFGMNVPARRLIRVAEAIDERPLDEDVHAHVRQVTPGDHLSKLKPETIDQLNSILCSVLDEYGYEK